MSFVPHALNLRNTALLLIPPLLWAGNAVIGRMIADLIPPITLNFFRWALAFVMLLPLAHGILRPSSPLWTHWKRYALLGLLGVGCYNSLLYLALQTSTPINVTLVGASMPVFMLLIGAFFFKQTIRKRQIVGALLSVFGVLVVLCRGNWQALAEVHLVLGDGFVLLATVAWSWYSWLLSRTQTPVEARSNWANFLMSQLVFGLFWSASFSGAEWSGLTGIVDAHVHWSWPLAAALVYVSVGPAVLAYRFWGLGIQNVGPNIAGFFVNLIPVFTAILSTLLLGEVPQIYHAVAFALIIGGIVVSSRK